MLFGNLLTINVYSFVVPSSAITLILIIFSESGVVTFETCSSSVGVVPFILTVA